jgi:hypothetical protein
VVKQALGSMAPFTRQLHVEKQFSNRKARAFLPAYAPEPPGPLIEWIAERLVATRWGRQNQTAGGARESVMQRSVHHAV